MKKMSRMAYLMPLLMIVAMFYACTARIGDPDPPEDLGEPAPISWAPPEIVREDPDASSPSYHSTVEYGRSYLLRNNSGPLRAYIRFPQAGNAADAVIYAWANEIYLEARDILEAEMQVSDTAAGEIIVYFSSYLVDDRYAGVILSGAFWHSNMIRPSYITHTFNINIAGGTLIENADMIDFNQLESVLALLRDRIPKEYDEYPDLADSLRDELAFGDMDASWLNNMAIGHDGLIVVFERGEQFASALGNIFATLPYDELGPALLLDLPLPVPDGAIDPSRPAIAITFDDGPGGYTARLLDLLEEHDARATFCVLGELLHFHEHTLARAVESGNEVIGHSWNHARLTEVSEAEIRWQILDTSRAIEQITGVSTNLFRPPYGSVDDDVKRISKELGFAILDWSVDPLDWRYRDADHIYDAVMNDVRNGSIILVHEIYSSTIEAMERIIPELVARGYQLVTVSELLEHAHGEILPGVVYSNGYPRQNRDTNDF